MPVIVTWDNDTQTTLHYEFIDPWTWDDYYTALITGGQLNQQQTVRYFLLDFTASREVGPRAISHFSYAARAVESMPHKPVFVFVKAGAFLRALGSVMSRLFPGPSQNVHHMDSLEAARAFIQRDQEQRNASAPATSPEPPKDTPDA